MELRDYYLDPAPDRNDVLKELHSLEAESTRLLADLRNVTAHLNELATLKAQFADILLSTRTAAEENWAPIQRFDFLQKEIIPRRELAARLLREIEKANQSSLTDSEMEMRDTRTGAARRLLIILGTCLLCGLLIAWITIRQSEELEAESLMRFQEVLQAKQQLESLSARLMEVQEEERTRLSRELHDEIVQNLAVLKMEIVQAQSLARNRNDGIGEPLARARGLAEETVRSVRDISLLLRPSLLDDLGLGPALQWQAEEFSRRTGVPCRLEDTNLSDDLSDAIKTCVYRVTQEALRNCEQHSSCTEVRVHVEQGPDSLSVTIEDDGKGFSSNRRTPSNLGVLGMQERACSLGGHLEISNRPEGGAAVRLIVPLAIAGVERSTGVRI
ncbi:MAG: sensor histidine kinase [Bryobacteraceae bacterium]|nr:sensor histidine kinase [Bryobacteraceae bacterium]